MSESKNDEINTNTEVQRLPPMADPFPGATPEMAAELREWLATNGGSPLPIAGPVE